MEAPFNFCGLSSDYSEYEKSKIVVLPVPFDKTTTWIKGTSKGPNAIIDASRNMELYDIDTDFEVYKEGICTLPPIEMDDEINLIKSLCEKVTNLYVHGKFVVTLGGEHTVTIGPVSAFSKLYGDLSVIIFDAHADMRETYEDNKYSHACVAKRIKDLGIEPLQIGIRSMDISEKKNIKDNLIYYAKDIVNSEDAWIDHMFERLSQNVYISIDLDVFEPSVIPSVGTPEPGGISWYEMIKILKKITNLRKIVAFDVVELCPNEQKYSDFAAAKLTYSLLSMIFKNNAG
jgi:agmatinase